MALGLAASWAIVGAARADDAWRTWNAGPLSFEAPAAMSLSTDFDQKLTPLNLAHPDWLLKLVAAQGDARALTARFSWAPDALGAESGTNELSRAAITFAGRPALRREWRDDDVVTRGFDILAPGWGPKGAVFEFTCYAGAKDWAKLQPNCERIAASVRVAGLVATNPAPPPTPTPPTPTSTAKPPPLPTNTSIPSPPPTPPAKTIWSPPPPHETLFAGALDARWDKLQGLGGDFAAFAKLDNGALAVDVPAGHSWGRTGVASASFAGVFLDDFGAGAQQTFTFRFDPARSTAFVAALVADRDWCARGGAPTGVAFVFAPKVEGGGATARLVDLGDGGKNRVQTDVAATGAKEVAIVLTPGKTAVSLDGVKLGGGDAKGVEAHVPLSICVFTQGRDANQPAAMALKQVVVDRQPGAPEREPRPAAGVAPLQSIVLFGSKATVAWEGQAPYLGGDFSKFGALRDGRLDIVIPQGDGGRTTGIVSKTQVVSFDAYADEAPYQLRYAFDPLRTTDFVVELVDPRTWDWHYVHMVAGVNRRDGKVSEFFVRYCPGAEMRRAMPAQWNGDFELVLHNGWATVGIPGAFAVRCDESSFGYQHSFFDIVATSPEKDGLPAAVTLLGATLDRLPPAGMTAEQRWRYVADKDFDPAAFAKDLAADVGSAEIELP